MKNILLSMLLLPGTLATAKDKKEKAEPAFKKGTITVTAGTSIPVADRLENGYLTAAADFFVRAEYQATRRFAFGLTHMFIYRSTKNNIYKTPTGAWMQRQAVEQYNIGLATVNYCYLNRGRVSLGVGIGLGISDWRSRVNRVDSNNLAYTTNESDRGFTAEVRLLDAKVKVHNNLAVYARYGFSYYPFYAAGLSYNFLSKNPLQAGKNGPADPAFRPGDISFILSAGSTSFFGILNLWYTWPVHYGVDAQYQLTRALNAGITYDYDTRRAKPQSYQDKTTLYTSYVNQSFRQHKVMATVSYTYLNRNNASVGIGAAMGVGREYFSTEIIRNNNTEYHHEGRSSKSPFVYDLRIVETKVHMGKGMGMYGRLSSHSGITVGMLYNMHTRP